MSSGVKLILSNSPDEPSRFSFLRLPTLRETLEIMLILSDILPFFITIALIKCLLIDYSENPTMVYLSYFGMSLYHICLICLHQSAADKHQRSQVLWIDIDFHKLAFLLLTFYFHFFPRFEFLQYALVFLYKALRIFDSKVIVRTGESALLLRKMCRLVLLSTRFQQLRVILEMTWIPYLLFSCVSSVEISTVLFLYYYFFFIIVYDFQFDKFHQWFWLKIDHFFTVTAFDQPEPLRSLLLKTLFHIRRCGVLGEILYPPIKTVNN